MLLYSKRMEDLNDMNQVNSMKTQLGHMCLTRVQNVLAHQPFTFSITKQRRQTENLTSKLNFN